MLSLLEESDKRDRENKLKDYRPYVKQLAFHEAGAEFDERLLMAGNQLGKTVAGAAEAAMHLTGRYPDWWQGRRWDRPTTGWVSGVTGLSTRDTVQKMLFGRMGQVGTGMVPKADIIEATNSRGTPDLFDHVTVKHISGGTSIAFLKSYEMGREKWQGETIDFVWYDEEPPEQIYDEGKTRTIALGGLVWMTFTPLKGRTRVVSRFLSKEKKTEQMHVTTMTIEDVEHYSPERRAEIVAGYAPHEREARARGIPIMGSGLVFPVAEHVIRCDPFPIPEWWACVGGLDFGWDHPFAAVKLAHDRDTDCVYVTHIYRQRESTPLIHSAALKPWGNYFPWAWPHDGLKHVGDATSARPLAQYYRECGLNIHFEHAQFDVNQDGSPGGFGLEAGISMMLGRLQEGRLKVFSTCGEWFEEYRGYHRKEGLIVKEDDDLMSATRIALMMLRIAQSKKRAPIMDKYARRKNQHQGSQWTA